MENQIEGFQSGISEEDSTLSQFMNTLESEFELKVFNADEVFNDFALNETDPADLGQFDSDIKLGKFFLLFFFSINKFH
jgi:hypothetical protein